MLNNPYLIYGLVFAAALLAVDTVLRWLSSKGRTKTQIVNRLEGLKQKKGIDQAYGDLLKSRGLSERDGTQTLGGWKNQLIGQSGKEISGPSQALWVMALSLIGFLLALVVITTELLFAVIFGVVFGVGMAIFILIILRRRRIRAFTHQLAPAIDIIVRSLSAGHPLTTSIALVAKEMADPIGSEFGLLSDQLTFGSELNQALLNMYDRVGVDELNMVIISISVQRGTGGNLAEILENLAKMIRDRIMIRAKIKAISAEGRVTAWIMLLFPIGLFYMLNFMVPTYFDLVWESGYGTLIVSVCLTMIFFGMMIIRKLVNFDF